MIENKTSGKLIRVLRKDNHMTYFKLKFIFDTQASFVVPFGVSIWESLWGYRFCFKKYLDRFIFYSPVLCSLPNAQKVVFGPKFLLIDYASVHYT